MLMATHLIGFGNIENVASVVMTDHAVDAVDRTTYTFTAKSLGAPAAGRRIAVIAKAMAGGSISASSLTVAGNSATSVVTTGAATESGAIYIIADGSNLTGDIVVTWSGGAARCAIDVFAMYDLLTSTATDTGTSTANPANDTLNISAGGVAIGGVIANSLSATPTWTWTNLTETHDETVEGGDKTGHSGAAKAFASAQSGLSITATPSSFFAGIMLLASFR